MENKEAYHEPTRHRYRHEEIEEGLADCCRNKIFNKLLLESVFIEQQPFGKWCLEKGWVLPSFWFSSDWKLDKYNYGSWNIDGGSEESPSNEQTTISSKPETKLRSNQIDKSVCQAIARTLWDIHPQMTIADMCKHEAIQRYGNDKLYGGIHTLRGWLSEVAPPEVRGKRCRPKKSET